VFLENARSCLRTIDSSAEVYVHEDQIGVSPPIGGGYRLFPAVHDRYRIPCILERVLLGHRDDGLIFNEEYLPTGVAFRLGGRGAFRLGDGHSV
jgi:hypothetical protein